MTCSQIAWAVTGFFVTGILNYCFFFLRNKKKKGHCVPFRASDRKCEWPGCECFAEVSCCYCEGHLIIGPDTEPVYHDGGTANSERAKAFHND